jgi:DNA repair photolyase
MTSKITNPLGARKGRGATSNETGRFEARSHHASHDGWEVEDWDPVSEDAPPLRTTVTDEAAKTIISRNSSPDIPFDQSVNPYRGCEHGCVYCYARPSHAYLGLSPGLDFESRLFAKPGAAEMLERELAKRSYTCRPIMLGSNTDPYQPIERDRQITRSLLEVMLDCHQPVAITTKSANVLRDLDILQDMASRRLVAVGMSVTTLDRNLARTMEPRASTPPKRLQAIRALVDAGVPVSLMAAPMIPQLNDHELENLMEAAADHGVRDAAYILLRLPLEIKDLFADWLEEHVPDRAARVLNHIRDTRNGALYDSSFETRMSGTGEYAKLLGRRFSLACKRLGLNKREASQMPLDTSQFTAPVLPGAQPSLL